MDALACRKAPDEDGISPKVIKCIKPAVLKPLHGLLSLYWREVIFLRTYTMLYILSYIKTRLTVMSATATGVKNYWKSFSWVVLTQVQVLADHIYPDSQCGFMVFTVDMIFSLCQSREMPQRTDATFIDISNVSNLYCKKVVFQLLKKINCRS